MQGGLDPRSIQHFRSIGSHSVRSWGQRTCFWGMEKKSFLSYMWCFQMGRFSLYTGVGFVRGKVQDGFLLSCLFLFSSLSSSFSPTPQIPAQWLSKHPSTVNAYVRAMLNSGLLWFRKNKCFFILLNFTTGLNFYFIHKKTLCFIFHQIKNS